MPSVLPAIHISPNPGGEAGQPGKFDPNVLEANAGDNVFWYNATGDRHQIVQLANGAPQNPPLTDPISPKNPSTTVGLSQNTPVDKEYTLSYACLDHPNEKGSITVKPPKA